MLLIFCIRFRSLASVFLEKDMALSEQLKKQQQEEKNKSGWLSKVWNYIPSTSSSSLFSLELTPDVLKELYNEVYEERDQPLQMSNLPKKYTKMRINFSLGMGSIEIKHSTNSNWPNIAKACFIGYQISFDKREDSFTFCGNLESMELFDFHTENTKFQRLISPIITEDDEYPYFFTMILDKKPFNSIADYSLQLSTKPLDIVVSKPFINCITNFFSKPITKIRRKRMAELELQAYTRLQEIRQQTEEQLKQAMAERKILDLKVHLSAPNIMIPKNFDDSNTPMLILILGTLSITSDLNEKKMLLTDRLSGEEDDEELDFYSDVDTESEFERAILADKIHSEHAGDKEFSYLYDKFYLSFTSLEAVVSNSMDYYTHHSIKEVDDVIIEKFDVNLYLEVCNIESYELPKVKVVGNLPSLGINISPQQTARIMQILNSMNRRTDDKILIGSHFDEEESNIENLQLSNNRAVSAEDSQPEITSADKKILLVAFSIPEVILTIKESENDLIILWIKGINGSYLKKTYDINVTLAVHGAIVEDRMQPWGDDFRYLATSELHKNVNIDDLIHITYLGVSSSSPQYKDINHSVEFKFRSLDVMLNRETIVVLVDCLKAIVATLKSDSNSQENNFGDQEKTEEITLTEKDREIILFSVSASVNNVGFTLNDTGVKIGVINIRNSSATLQLHKTTTFIQGKMGSVNVEDFDPASRLYPQMFEIDGNEEMVSFIYRTYDKDSHNFPGYSVLLKFTLNSIRYLWLERFQLRIRQYFSEISAMQALLSKTATSVGAAISDQRRIFKFEFQLNNPYIVIPKNCNSSKGLIADLGLIHIYKEFPLNEDGVMMTRTCIDVKEMNLKAGILGGSTFQTILLNTDIQIYWEKPYDDSKLKEHIYPSFYAFLDFPKFHIVLTEQQALQICATVIENICSEPTDHEKYVSDIKRKLNNQLQESNPTLSILQNRDSDSKIVVNEIDDNFEFQPDDERWVEMRIDFLMHEGKLEMLRSSGVDENGDPLTVGELEVLEFEMRYDSFSNSSQCGDFSMESFKVYDRRFHSKNQFKELLTPLVPGKGKLKELSDIKPPSIVGDINRTKQFCVKYERSSDNYQLICFSFDHSYFICIPDAIFEIYGLMKPIIFDDIVQTTQIWRTWKNTAPVVVIPSSKLRDEMDIKIVITRPELFFLEDPTNINTQSIVIRSTFNIIYKRNGATNHRSWCIMVDQMEAYKCRLASEGNIISIMNPINWVVDWIMTDNQSTILCSLDNMIFAVSYKDYLVCKEVFQNWKPWLTGQAVQTKREVLKDKLQLEAHFLNNIALRASANEQLLDNQADGESSDDDLLINEDDTEIVPFKGNNIIEEEDDYSENQKLVQVVEELQSFDPKDSYFENLNPKIKDLVIEKRKQGKTDFMEEYTPLRRDKLEDSFVEESIIVEDILLLENPIEQTLILKTSSIKFILIDDSIGETNTPLANIILGNFKLDLASWSVNMDLKLTSDLQIDYYNNQLEVWEPVIEPWGYKFTLTKPLPNLVKYGLTANRLLQMNITHAMIETTLNTYESITQSDYILNLDTGEEIRPNLHPFVVKNETGTDVWYWLSNYPELKNVAVGKEEPLFFDGDVNIFGKRNFNEEQFYLPTVNIQIMGDYTPVKNLPIDKIGTYVMRVSPVDSFSCMAFEVSHRRGCKVLTIKSNMNLKNATSKSLQTIAIVDYHDTEILDPIGPDQSCAVPMNYTTQGNLRFRPTEDYRWSEPAVTLSELRQRLAIRRLLMCKTTLPSDKNFYYYLYITTTHNSKFFQITLNPPYVIENLLPTTMEYRFINRHTRTTITSGNIPKGEYIQIQELDPKLPLSLSIKIANFGWSKSEDISSNEPAEVIHLTDEKKRTLSLRIINSKEVQGTRKISIFSQYWMVNMTGLKLIYRRSGLDSSLVAGQGYIENEEVNLSNDPREWYTSSEERSKPFLFTTSYYNLDPRGDLAKVSIANSQWSQNINLNSEGNTSILEIEDSPQNGKQTRVFQLTLKITSAPNQFWRSKIVTFYSRFVIINNMDREFIYRQKGTMANLCTIGPQENIPFHWADKDSPPHLCIRLNSAGWDWSGGFEISELGNFCIKMRNKETDKYYLARVRIRIENATTLIAISSENREYPDYQIVNQTSTNVDIRQIKCKAVDTIKPGETVPYSWDEPLRPHILLLSFPHSSESTKKYKVLMDYLQWYSIVTIGNIKIRVEVSAQGPTKVLTVKYPFVKEKNIKLVEQNQRDDNLLTKFELSFAGIGISVIDEVPIELMYIAIERIYFAASNSSKEQTIDFAIDWLQIDNQLYYTPFPNVLFPLMADGSTEKAFFHLSIVKSNTSTSIDYFKRLTAILQEFNLKVDEEFLLKVMQFINHITNFFKKRKEEEELRNSKEEINNNDENLNHVRRYRKSNPNINFNISENDEDDEYDDEIHIFSEEKKREEKEEEGIELDSDFSVLGHSQVNLLKLRDQRKMIHYPQPKMENIETKWLYFEVLHLNPVKVNFSFANVSGVERKIDSMISRILSRGGVFANIDSAPIQLNCLILEHPFTSRSDLFDRITKHYMNSTIREFHKMLGSADLLGSPISFVSTLGTGFYDFFHEPALGLGQSPSAFGIGLAKGTGSLVKNSTFGTFNSLAKFAGTVGKGAAELTFDRNYVKERELMSREKPKHVVEGVAFGVRDLGTGIFEGIGGIIVCVFLKLIT